MITAILLSAALQTGQPANPANTLAISNNGEDRWPASGPYDFRWTLTAPSGLAPFVVATSTRGQIAVRRVNGQTLASSYYVAMRQTDERLEEADSRECEFGGVILALKDLATPLIVVPGTPTPPANPAPIHGAMERVTVFGSRQPTGERADLTIAAADGPANQWIRSLFTATQSCWKPMRPPDPA